MLYITKVNTVNTASLSDAINSQEADSRKMIFAKHFE